MKNRKKEISTLIIGILILITLIVGTTYAFFQARVGKGESVEANVKTGTLGTLTFTKGEDITINVIPKDFGIGGANAEGKTNLKALLLTEYTDKTEYTYNVYLEILKNNLEYSSFKEIDGNKTLVFKTNYEKTLGNNIDYNGLTNGYGGIPELLLTVTGPKTFTNNIEGLKKATLQEKEDSYDITQLREGIYPIAEDIPIKVLQNDGGLKEDKWEVKVTYKNLDNTQIINLNREFKAKVRIQKEKIANDLMDVCSSGENLRECIIKLHDKSEYGASNLIYHDGQPDYEGETNYQLEAGDNSYRYTGSFEKVNNYICLGSSCSTDPNDPDYHNLYRIVGVFGDEIKLVKADYANKEQLGEGTQTPEKLDNLDEIDTNTYGSYAMVYPYQKEQGNNEEKDAFIHRYKGKLNHVDRYYWQENGTASTVADWKTSLLNKIHLNNVYLGKIDSKYQSLIADHLWTYGNDNAIGTNIANKNAQIVYNNEIGKSINANPKTDREKIGLLYMSDYMYSASHENWSKQLLYGGKNPTFNNDIFDKDNNLIGCFPEGLINTDYCSATNNNWLYLGLYEWSITTVAGFNNRAFNIDFFGNLASGWVAMSPDNTAIRPSLYIKNTTKLLSGIGTAGNPYMIS